MHAKSKRGFACLNIETEEENKQQQEKKTFHVHVDSCVHNKLTIHIHRPTREADKEKKMTSLPLKDIPQDGVRFDIDVLIGRGGYANRTVGITRYMEFVESYQEQYNRIPTKAGKIEFSERIVRKLRKDGVRFLIKDNGSGLWNDVGDRKMRVKVSQNLRECKPHKPKLHESGGSATQQQRQTQAMPSLSEMSSQRIPAPVMPDQFLWNSPANQSYPRRTSRPALENPFAFVPSALPIGTTAAITTDETDDHSLSSHLSWSLCQTRSVATSQRSSIATWDAFYSIANDDPSLWSISYEQLMSFHQESKAFFGDRFPSATMRDICRDIIEPVCRSREHHMHSISTQLDS